MFFTPPDKTRETALAEHLNWWGLRRFETDDAYFQWQRESLSAEELSGLHRLVEQKRGAPGDARAETAFYDRTADVRILPVLYSQRYDYYFAVGPLVAERIGRMPGAPAGVLDFGCGIGLLTTFYARQFPHLQFVGIDRSAESIEEAKRRAQALGLTNVRFECLDAAETPLRGAYDLILATHALLQSEHDPGLPSLSWQTFERAGDSVAQGRFENRTGLASRLNALRGVLSPAGSLIVFEKARLLGRRIPFQRAFADRGFRLIESPIPVPYRIIEETSDDGPLYLMTRATAGGRETVVQWSEQPDPIEEGLWFRCMGRVAEFVKSSLPARTVLDEQLAESPFGRVRIEQGRSGERLVYGCWEFQEKSQQFITVAPAWMKEPASALVSPFAGNPMWPGADEPDELDHVPLYENHANGAQTLWERLPDRTLLMEQTWNGKDGYQMHAELGTTGGLVYLYQANTFDQRQMVMMEPARRAWLERYYQEIVQSDE